MTPLDHLRAAGVRAGKERVAWLALVSLRLVRADAPRDHEPPAQPGA